MKNKEVNTITEKPKSANDSANKRRIGTAEGELILPDEFDDNFFTIRL